MTIEVALKNKVKFHHNKKNVGLPCQKSKWVSQTEELHYLVV
jgi:hypothetical protein